MKQCPKCGLPIQDEDRFCVRCGGALKGSHLTQKKLIVIVTLIAVVALGVLLFILLSDNSRFEQAARDVDSRRTERIISEYFSTPRLDDLVVAKGWRFYTEGDYVYVEGHVTNLGDNEINYFEITAEFLDSSGRVLDTDWTNGTNVSPGASKSFKIMCKKPYGLSKAQVKVTDVS